MSDDWTPRYVGSIPKELLDEMDDEHSRQAREEQ
jgi:hypothetical protein